MELSDVADYRFLARTTTLIEFILIAYIVKSTKNQNYYKLRIDLHFESHITMF